MFSSCKPPTETLLHGNKDKVILHRQCHGCWSSGDVRSQGNSSHSSDQMSPEHSHFSTRNVNKWSVWWLWSPTPECSTSFFEAVFPIQLLYINNPILCLTDKYNSTLSLHIHGSSHSGIGIMKLLCWKNWRWHLFYSLNLPRSSLCTFTVYLMRYTHSFIVVWFVVILSSGVNNSGIYLSIFFRVGTWI